MKSTEQEVNLSEYTLKGLKRQPTQYPCNFHVIGDVSSTNKNNMLTQSINQINNNRNYCNNSINYGHNIEINSRTDVQKFVEKPLSNNRNCNNHLEFQQSHLEVLNLLKWFLKWKYFHHLLLFTLTLSIIIGLIAYGIWLHSVSLTRQQHSFNETEIVDMAQVDEMLTDQIDIENTTDLTSISITKPQRLLLVNSLLFNSNQTATTTNLFSSTEVYRNIVVIYNYILMFVFLLLTNNYYF